MYLLDNEMKDTLAPVDPMTAAILREKRKGKKTVALVGMSPTSCGLTPFDEPEVDIWGLNETHSFGWFKRMDVWFQMHKPQRYARQATLKRKIYGHYAWLKEPHEFPIYMLHKDPDIPNSIEYPLAKIRAKFLDNIYIGEEKANFFTSTFEYMLALALYQEKYQRIEIYGFEMSALDEWALQRPGGTFWIGMAAGSGVELYFPPRNQILSAPLYGYERVGYDHLDDDGIE